MNIFNLSIVLALIVISALCSGLNVALMSLDPNDLRRKAKAGNKSAKRVIQFRKDVHLSLASILLTNVAVISATSLVLSNFTTGLIAGIVSTLLIVVFGEVIPQAIFTKHSLRFMSRFAPLLRLMIIVTYPVSKPLELLLDKLLGHEVNLLHSRMELGVMIDEHLEYTDSELDEDEVEIMRGALSLSEKRVRDIMTPLKEVYYLNPGVVIDGKRIDEIKQKAYSRVPVLSKDKKIAFGTLLMKELVDIDFDNNPKKVSEFKLYPSKPVGSMTALDTLFRMFIGRRSQLMPVEKAGKIVGIVTIEDLIEEIIGHEIVDETDIM